MDSRGLNSFCASCGPARGLKTHILRKCFIQGKHHTSTSIYHTSSKSSKYNISNIIKSLHIFNVVSQLVNILVAQFILYYKQHFLDQVVDQIRPELMCGSVVYGCFKKFPTRGPVVRVWDAGCIVCGSKPRLGVKYKQSGQRTNPGGSPSVALQI